MRPVNSTSHVHEFTPGKSGTVAVCRCGAFRHLNVKPEDAIVEQRDTNDGRLDEWPDRDDDGNPTFD